MELALIFTSLAAIAMLVAWLVCLARIDRLRQDLSVSQALKDAAEQDYKKMANRFITALMEMKKGGFETVPEDDRFESYALTPEQEAQIERDRIEGLGSAVTAQPQTMPDIHPLKGGFVGEGPAPRPARPPLRVE